MTRKQPDSGFKSGLAPKRSKVQQQRPSSVSTDDATAKVMRALRTHRPQPTETQCEYVDRAILTKILKAARKSKPKCLHLLESFMRRFKEVGSMTCFYEARGYRKHGIGRFYAKGASVQHLPRGLRALLCQEAAADVDFERCAPTICLALARCVRTETPELEAIVRDRGAWLERTGCDKEMISKVMNGHSQNMHTWHSALLALRLEMRKLDCSFCAHELSAPIREVLGEGAHADELRRVAVDTLEDRALSLMIDTFEHAGSKCVGRIYDGAHQLKLSSNRESLDLDAIASAATDAIEREIGFRLVARVKPFEPPCDQSTGAPCETVEAALAADALFAADEHQRPTTPADILELVAQRFDHPWFVVSPSDEERLLVVRDMLTGTWSMDKYALKEYVKAIGGELGICPRTVRLYDELADFASKDAPSTVPGDVFRGCYMMRHCAHLMPFADGKMLNLNTGAHEPILPSQYVWSKQVTNWSIPAEAAYAELLGWSKHYQRDHVGEWMPQTYAINTSHVPPRSRFEPPRAGETELQCIARDVASLLVSILGPLHDTVLDRICPALFERVHSTREFIVLSGTGSEGKSLLFALLRLVAQALVVKADALCVGGRGLCGNNESWYKAKGAAIVVTEEVGGTLDGNVYKDLSGGNGVSISCSKKYGHEIETKFGGLVVLLTNNRLDFKPLDGALADRMIVARMPSKFVRSAAKAKAAYGEKAHVKVYAAFGDELYVERLFETDPRYRAALVAYLYAHYCKRKGQYAPLDVRYDAKPEYVAECASSTPTGMFDMFWVVDQAASGISMSAKDMFQGMRNELALSSSTLPLQWKSAASLGKYLSARFNGAQGTLPMSKDSGHGTKVWFGFARVDVS